MTKVGKVVNERTHTSNNNSRVKGTFCISSQNEIIRLIRFLGGNKILEYAIKNINYNNEFSFSDDFLKSYNNKNQFYIARKKLIKSGFLFETDFKNVYSVDIDLINKVKLKKAEEIKEKQKKWREKYEQKNYKKQIKKLNI